LRFLWLFAGRLVLGCLAALSRVRKGPFVAFWLLDGLAIALCGLLRIADLAWMALWRS
jgi:hypothetical protein